MNKKLRLGILVLFTVLVAQICLPMASAQAQSNTCTTINGNEVCSDPATLAAILMALDNQGGGSAVAESNVALQPTPEVAETVAPESGCFMVEGALIEEVPCEDTAIQAFSLGQGGGEELFAPLDFTPRGDSYAPGVEPVGQGWTRIRETVDGQYTSWNFHARVTCDRPTQPGEVQWDRPIHFVVTPNIEAGEREEITCLVEVRRDLDSSINWQSAGHASDPYDSSLAGQGELLGWFVGGYADVVMNNGQSLTLATEVCSDPAFCPVPTFTVNPPDGIVPTQQWSAAPGGEGEHHVAVIREFPRDSEEILSWLVTVKPGDEFVLWQGVVTPQTETAMLETVQAGGGTACALTANQQINVRVSPSTTANAEPLIAGASLPINGESGNFWIVPGGYISKTADVTLSEGCLG